MVPVLGIIIVVYTNKRLVHLVEFSLSFYGPLIPHFNDAYYKVTKKLIIIVCMCRESTWRPGLAGYLGVVRPRA
jgi:hypothetical protein